MTLDADAILHDVLPHFVAEGEPQSLERSSQGHIHDTWVATWRDPNGQPFRLVHQRLNERVFRDLTALTDNLLRVTRHLRRRLDERGVSQPERRALEAVVTRSGEALHRDADGAAWRTFRFIEGTRSVDVAESPRQAFEVARAFGAFTAELDDLEPPPLVATIPHFHDLGSRLANLEEAVSRDPMGRVAAAGREIDAARRGHDRIAAELVRGGAGALEGRVVHHDCKINNVLLDAATGEALCVIDLDTAMPGSVLSDFGELVRTTTCPAAEDERRLERIRVDLNLFEAVADGYLEGAGALLDAAERDLLPLAGELFALMNAIRFLTDHLEGDVYFRTRRPDHNLDRTRAQLRLFQELGAYRPACEALLAR